MSDDILHLLRLRRFVHTGGTNMLSAISLMKVAIDEIERLREQLRLANIDNFETTAEVERLRAERDEVRKSYCSLMEAYRGGDGRVTANKLGWGYLFPRRPKKEDGK